MYTAKGQLDREALIRQHVPLVRRLAHHMIAKLPPNIELDDLIQVGMIGLTEALSRYEAAQGVQFETFATQRIRGAMLDELRARAQLAIKAGVDITKVTEMTIWGNHSATQYPDFYHAKINGVSAAEVIHDEKWLKEAFVSTVQQRGAAIIKARGASSAASAANAIIQGVHHLVTDTPAHESFSMCLSSTGQYGVDKGLIFSYPCRVKGGKLEVVEGLKFNDYGQAKFDATLEELRQEKAAVQELNLI